LHPYQQDAWIYYPNQGGSSRILKWIENDEVIQTVTFKGLETYTPCYDYYDMKIFPVPGGAAIGYVRRNQDGKLVHDLLYWKVQPEIDGQKIIYDLSKPVD
ncbi:MAG: hypothetical protein ACOCZS_02495, partial [Verrucomicrobiota bacterium]